MDYLGYFFGILTAIAIVFVILLILSFITVYVYEHFLSKFFKWIGVKTRSSQLQKDYEIPGLISEGFEQGLSSVEVSENMSAISKSLEKLIVGGVLSAEEKSACLEEARVSYMSSDQFIDYSEADARITEDYLKNYLSSGEDADMSKPYWHCEACGGNFDIGERCDCESSSEPTDEDLSNLCWHCMVCGADFNFGEKCGCSLSVPVISVDEEIAYKNTCDLLIVGIDMSTNGDMPCITVSRNEGRTTTVIRTLFGQEAEDLYGVLLGAGNIRHAE